MRAGPTLQKIVSNLDNETVPVHKRSRIPDGSVQRARKGDRHKDLRQEGMWSIRLGRGSSPGVVSKWVSEVHTLRNGTSNPGEGGGWRSAREVSLGARGTTRGL